MKPKQFRLELAGEEPRYFVDLDELNFWLGGYGGRVPPDAVNFMAVGTPWQIQANFPRGLKLGTLYLLAAAAA